MSNTRRASGELSVSPHGLVFVLFLFSLILPLLLLTVVISLSWLFLVYTIQSFRLLDTYSVSMASVMSKTLCIVINVRVLWV